jgi:hypothetical protein
MPILQLRSRILPLYCLPFALSSAEAQAWPRHCLVYPGISRLRADYTLLDIILLIVAADNVLLALLLLLLIHENRLAVPVPLSTLIPSESFYTDTQASIRWIV